MILNVSTVTLQDSKLYDVSENNMQKDINSNVDNKPLNQVQLQQTDKKST